MGRCGPGSRNRSRTFAIAPDPLRYARSPASLTEVRGRSMREPAAGATGLSGHVLENPISGERIVIRESGAQNGGRLLAFALSLPPGGPVPARHVPPAQE